MRSTSWLLLASPVVTFSACALIAVGASGCPPQPSLCVRSAADSLALDSLRTALHTADTALSQQRVRVALAKGSMARFAAIVRRDPTQAKFLVGWTNRAFQGVLP